MQTIDERKPRVLVRFCVAKQNAKRGELRVLVRFQEFRTKSKTKKMT